MILGVGSTAFDPALTPLVLYESAAQLPPEADEAREWYEAFAAELAEIQNLPEIQR